MNIHWGKTEYIYIYKGVSTKTKEGKDSRRHRQVAVNDISRT